jgi:hypothetical protein
VRRDKRGPPGRPSSSWLRQGGRWATCSGVPPTWYEASMSAWTSWAKETKNLVPAGRLSMQCAAVRKTSAEIIVPEQLCRTTSSVLGSRFPPSTGAGTGVPMAHPRCRGNGRNTIHRPGDYLTTAMSSLRGVLRGARRHPHVMAICVLGSGSPAPCGRTWITGIRADKRQIRNGRPARPSERRRTTMDQGRMDTRPLDAWFLRPAAGVRGSPAAPPSDRGTG